VCVPRWDLRSPTNPEIGYQHLPFTDVRAKKNSELEKQMLK